MKAKTLLASLLTTASLAASAQAVVPGSQGTGKERRALWASINNIGNASLGSYATHTGKLLFSWRMLPTDTWDTSFLIYSRMASQEGAQFVRLTQKPVTGATCYQTSSLPTNNRVYYLLPGDYFTGTPPLYVSAPADKEALRQAALDTLLVDKRIVTDKLPYLSIPLQPTDDVCSNASIKYQANDCSVGDLDGDGMMEVVVKRLLSVYDASGQCISDGTGAGSSDRRTQHCVVWDAYKLDGTLLWRIKSGPNIILGNSSNFAVADLDGDGRCEFVTKTGEGTVFGDGQEIGDTDGDGCTDYRDNWVTHYIGPSAKGPGGPEFFSVCDGLTGRELARAPYISATDKGSGWKAQSQTWGDDYWKRANSLRLGVASFDGQSLQVFLGRGVYGRTVVEGWQYADGQLTRLWHFDSSDAGGSNRNKDGKPNSAYGSQGNHAFNVADLDGDGRDEVMYGSCAFDDDGTGLWTTQLGHGDANHVGKFLPDRDGMQVFHCLETGKTQVALHDAATGALIWKKEDSADNDMGRCMVADIDPASPGCEFWMYGSNAFSFDGTKDLGYKPKSCNMGIWFDGTLSRQLINENIIDSPANGRTFTMYRYDESFNNGTKSNPGWYGDFLGDWREEVIVPDGSKLKDLKVFSTWYPSNYKLPWLMTDHTYYMQCVHEQVGYNQPTNVGAYYLGTGMDFSLVPLQEPVAPDGITTRVATAQSQGDSRLRDLMGRTVGAPRKGIYVQGGKKFVVR